MTTNYPAGIDTTTELPVATALAAQDLDDFPHSAAHGNANDAIRAIEAELGTAPSGASATVKARLDVIEAPEWVTLDRLVDSGAGGTLDSGNITYFKLGGFVFVFGLTDHGANIATLPAGYRPNAEYSFSVTAESDSDPEAAHFVVFQTDGTIDVTGETSESNRWTAFFPAA